MDVLSQSALIVAVSSFALGSSVLARNIRNKLFITFACLCGVISAWSFSFFLEMVFAEGGFYRVHLLLNVWLAPMGLLLIMAMTRIKDSMNRLLFRASIYLAALLSLVILFELDSSHRWLRQLIYFAPLLLLLQVFHLIWIDRRQKKRFQKEATPSAIGIRSGNRILIYFGAVFVLMTSVMDHLPFLGKGIPSVGNFGLTIYLFFLGQAITQQRLLNFGALLSRFLVLVSVSFTLTVIYSIVFAWIEDSLPLFFLNSFIISFLVLTLIDPINSLMRFLTRRLLTKEHRTIEEYLNESLKKSTTTVELESFSRVVLKTVGKVLQPRRASFFVLSNEATRYREIQSEVNRDLRSVESNNGDDPRSRVREILADHPLIEYCVQLNKKGQVPTVLDQILKSELDRVVSRAQRKHFRALIHGLRALHANLLIPVFDPEVEARVLGFVVMEIPKAPDPWGNNWGLLQIIYPFFEEAGLALKSLEVFVRQREKERLAELGEMSAGLAHEIRNPLGAIKGAAQYLDPESSRLESRFLRVIIEEVDRLNSVVTQFLDYSKQSNLEYQRVDLISVLEKTIEISRSDLPKNVRISFGRKESSTFVLGVSYQLQQLILNLIQNSIHAVGEKEDAKIEVRAYSSEANEAVFEVKDNGCGIKDENRDKLFIPFFTTSKKGTGLGLAICQKIVQYHRGRIEIESEENRFTKFSVVIPKEDAQMGMKRIHDSELLGVGEGR